MSLVIRAVLSIVLYFLANMHTFNIGVQQDMPPLHDDLHNILPDLSKYPIIRDILLIMFLIPLCLLKNETRIKIIAECFEMFMVIVTLKAITIFFTFLPPSNTHCHETHQVNHAYHQIFSGHNSFVFLLVLLYIKYGSSSALATSLFLLSSFAYAIIILMTRCHYTVDVILSFIVVYLLF
jgi:hypothetical protein